MKKKKLRLGALCCALSLLCAVCGCTNEENTNEAASESGASSGESIAADASDGAAETAFAASDAEMFTDRDCDADYDEAAAVKIELSGDSASVDGGGAEVSGSVVTISEAGTYVLSGTLDDGMVLVDAPESAKVQIVLDNASISSETCAALYVRGADKVFLTLAPGSENTLSNGGAFEAIDENAVDGAIFSKQDLTLNGTGSLTVNSPAGHGIVCKDDLAVTGGTYAITAASHGIDANDSVRVTGSTAMTIDAGKDGIHAENDEDTTLGFVYISNGTFEITAQGDGISVGASLQVEGGTFAVTAGGGSENAAKASSDSWGTFQGGGPDASDRAEAPAAEDTSADSTSMKGLKAAGEMRIADGSFTIDAADDAVHSDDSITICGGSFAIASGDDAVHADDTLTVTDGTIDISESYEGLEALHVDIQGGEISLTASDDGLNAAGGTDSSSTSGGRDGRFGGPQGGMSANSDGTITISGGTISIMASGDGIDSNGSLAISGGDISVVGPNQGDTATLDYDTTAAITGGTFLGTGAAGMAQTFSSSTQGVIAVSTGSQEAGTTVTISDEQGNVLLTYAPALPFGAVIFSSPELVTGETYTITAGTASGSSTAK